MQLLCITLSLEPGETDSEYILLDKTCHTGNPEFSVRKGQIPL